MSESMSTEYRVDEGPGFVKTITLTAVRVLGFWWFDRRPYRNKAKMLAAWETIAEEERAFWRDCTCVRGSLWSVPPRADCPAHFPVTPTENGEN